MAKIKYGVSLYIGQGYVIYDESKTPEQGTVVWASVIESGFISIEAAEARIKELKEEAKEDR